VTDEFPDVIPVLVVPPGFSSETSPSSRSGVISTFEIDP
jgi:hypothetical protein